MEIKETLGVKNKPVENRDQAAAVAKNGQQAASASGADAQAASADRVEISGRSREMARAADSMASAPEVRQDKVAEIKDRIESNQYQVDSEKVAHKMIVDFLNELV